MTVNHALTFSVNRTLTTTVGEDIITDMVRVGRWNGDRWIVA
jgi:hypothetical protein